KTEIAGNPSSLCHLKVGDGKLLQTAVRACRGRPRQAASSVMARPRKRSERHDERTTEAQRVGVDSGYPHALSHVRPLRQPPGRAGLLRASTPRPLPPPVAEGSVLPSAGLRTIRLHCNSGAPLPCP